MKSFYEFNSYETAVQRHRAIKRLGWTVSTIFKTARYTWAFHVRCF